MEVVASNNTWIEPVVCFIQSWGALIIASLSLITSIISIVKTSKAQGLQNKVNEIEIKLKEYELDKISKEKKEANRALVQARIICLGKNKYRLKVWNSGGSNAGNITVKFETDSGIIVIDNDKLPFEELEPMKSFELTLIIYPGAPTKTRVFTYWDDVDGSHHSKSQMVDY